MDIATSTSDLSATPPRLSQLEEIRGSVDLTDTYIVSDVSSFSPRSATYPQKSEHVVASSAHAVAETFPHLARMRWRLASAFFAYFLCGWGDGG
jgi:hypothetical protein